MFHLLINFSQASSQALSTISLFVLLLLDSSPLLFVLFNYLKGKTLKFFCAQTYTAPAPAALALQHWSEQRFICDLLTTFLLTQFWAISLLSFYFIPFRLRRPLFYYYKSDVATVSGATAVAALRVTFWRGKLRRSGQKNYVEGMFFS